MIIALDIDLTLVDSLTPWIGWYKHQTGHDLADIFTDQQDRGFNIQDLMLQHSSPLDYWKSTTLYDNLEPLPNSIEAVRALQELGHDIIFVSYCFPSHIDSKIAFIKRNFGPDVKFIDTKHKEYVKMDMIVDDHSEFLLNVQKLQPDCITITKKTPINAVKTDLYFEEWSEFLEKFKGII